MGNFTIGEAWSQGIAFISMHFRMIFIYVLAGILVPTILQFIVLGGAASTMFDPQSMMANPDNPFATLASLGAGFFAIAILGNIIQWSSYFASWRHGLVGGVSEPADDFAYAVGAAILSIIAFVLVCIGIGIVVALPLVLLTGIAVASGGDGAGGIGVLGLLLSLGALVFVLWLFARLCVTGPAMADARSVNPLYGFATSWRLTGASQWLIVAYLVLLMIVGSVIFIVLAAVVGIGMVGSMAAGGGGDAGLGTFILTAIIGLVAGVPMALAYIGIPAGIYRALVPSQPGDVFA